MKIIDIFDKKYFLNTVNPTINIQNQFIQTRFFSLLFD